MRVRPTYLIIAFILIVAGFLAFAVFTGDAAGPEAEKRAQAPEEPRISVETEHVDMGLISNEEKTTEIVAVSNEGTAPLRIKAVTGSCSCIRGQMVDEVEVIRPGESADLAITMDPFLVPGFETSKSITVYSDDPQLPRVILTVVCDIEPEFSLEPPFINFGTVEKGEEAVEEMVLRQITDKPVAIERLEFVSPAFQDTLELSFDEVPPEERVNPERAEYLIKARVLPTAMVGPWEARFRIRTNLKRLRGGFPTIVMAQVESFYSVDKKQIIPLRNMQPGLEDIERIRVASEQPITLKDASVSGEALVVEVQQIDKNTAEVVIHVAETAEPGRVRESLSFTVVGPERSVPEKLEVTGLLRPS
jgi:hypothetical protein